MPSCRVLRRPPHSEHRNVGGDTSGYGPDAGLERDNSPSQVVERSVSSVREAPGAGEAQ